MSIAKYLHILVAEDNEVNQLVLRRMLELAGHKVDTVLNGLNAVEALAKQQYDLVIMDCLMPLMDGFEATRTIRASTDPAVNCATPILAITALASPQDRWRCLAAGMTGYISKPVVANELYAWMSEHLGTAPRSVERRQPRKRIPESVDANKHLKSRTASQSGLIQEMAPVMLRDFRQWRQELKTHLDARNSGALGLLAHKIRGTADVFGYRELSTIAATLEKAARIGDEGDVAKLVHALGEALLRLIDDIERSP